MRCLRKLRRPSSRTCRRKRTRHPASDRCTWPGTNSVNELTIAITGRPNCSSPMPLARHNARAPAIRRPCVLILLLNGIFIGNVFLLVPEGKNTQFLAHSQINDRLIKLYPLLAPSGRSVAHRGSERTTPNIVTTHRRKSLVNKRMYQTSKNIRKKWRKYLVGQKKVSNFASLLREISGCSSVG